MWARACSRIRLTSGRRYASRFAETSLVTPKLESKLKTLAERHESLIAKLNHTESMEASAIASVFKEAAELSQLTTLYGEWNRANTDLDELFNLLSSSSNDEDMLEMAREEHQGLSETLQRIEMDIVTELVPKDSADEGSAILEIRAGAGGDEAALFAAEMTKMYERFAQERRWKWELLSCSELEGTAKGFKDVTVNIAGKSVFGQLKYESGVHRVQRVPATESQGRIHTSTITVAILPQPTEVDVQIKDADLRIDVYRSSGAGGQHVNTTDSAVRITHIPTGMTVAMQDERSQHKNKLKAMKVLRAKIYEQERLKTDLARRDSRNKQIGSGDRSEKIRTYNFPQNRVTDHRINLTLYELELIMTGQNLPNIIDRLKLHYDTEALLAINDE
ncbi:peptide chain release factor 1 [Umbelopsis sp. AD052]|nr:peptide chain release factor 1 [Umbelopsis sp. AD052]